MIVGMDKLTAKKLPGPAGLSSDSISKREDLTYNVNKFNTSSLASSKYSNFIVNNVSYQKLIQNFGLGEAKNPLNYLTLQMVLKMSRKKNDLRVPFLGLILASISYEHDIALKLVDSTMEVKAILESEVWEEIKEKLKINSAIALMQVPVIASGNIRSSISLYVAKKNILSIYTDNGIGEVEISNFIKVEHAILRQNCVDWMLSAGLNLTAKSMNSCLLSPEKFDSVEPIVKFDIQPKTRKDYFCDLNFSLDDFSEVMDLPPICSFQKELIGSTQCSGNHIPIEPNTLSEHENKSYSKCVNFKEKVQDSTENLSPSEKLMVEEVLFGISFEDF